jgi:hypothetical protein
MVPVALFYCKSRQERAVIAAGMPGGDDEACGAERRRQHLK